MSGELRDRVILLTGGGAGIGRGIALACQAAGATVVIGTLEGATQSVPDADVHALDVTDPAAIAAWVAAAQRRHGRIDGLVANAGITLTPRFLDADVATLDRLWEVNQRGVFLCAQAVAQSMQRNGTGGSIVTIASNHARASDAGYEMYAATKAGVVAMTRAMAWSLGPHGIRVNSLSPGLTATEAVAQAASDPARDATFRSWHASGRYNRVDEVGECAVFLLSDRASALTGTDLLADQGMAARLAAFE